MRDTPGRDTYGRQREEEKMPEIVTMQDLLTKEVDAYFAAFLHGYSREENHLRSNPTSAVAEEDYLQARLARERTFEKVMAFVHTLRVQGLRGEALETMLRKSGEFALRKQDPLGGAALQTDRIDNLIITILKEIEKRGDGQLPDVSKSAEAKLTTAQRIEQEVRQFAHELRRIARRERR